MKLESLPVYLLAGGQSRRFGSDKARAQLDGLPLLLHQAELLRPYATSLSVLADTAAKYADLGLVTLADRLTGLGPMGGLETALRDCRDTHATDWLLLASCDIWGVSRTQIETLLGASRQGVQAIAWQSDCWQPLWALYHVSLAEQVSERLQSGERALWRLLEMIPVRRLDGTELNWRQLNTPEDLLGP